MMKRIVRLGIVIGDDIRTRSRIHELEKYLKMPGIYILDFSDVCFISRSFADELISLMDNSTNKIECVNMSTEIEQLLYIVRANRNTPHNATVHGNVLQLSSVEQMTKYFEAI